ncbi:hypothetical protein HDU67_008077 [Dinochytrium kinnereticum]|nr:hypothetical protein HDU67_008077 [Dinochytrium kinnereticum]
MTDTPPPPLITTTPPLPPSPAAADVETRDGERMRERERLVEVGRGLLGDVKALESRASHYNALATQVQAEETACLKELKEKRRAVEEYLRLVRGFAGGKEVDEVASGIRRRMERVEVALPRPAK